MSENPSDKREYKLKKMIEGIYSLSESLNTDDLRIVAVTKGRSAEEIIPVLDAGIVEIGENRVQEYLKKESFFKSRNLKEHFIGHLQSNKVSSVVGKVEYIDSVDSVKLAKLIGKRAEKLGTVQNILIQVNSGYDKNKYGFLPESLDEAVHEISHIAGIKVMGLMNIPPFGDDEITKKSFELTEKLFVDIKRKKIDNMFMCFLSMGMSSDYEIALRCGSNMLRLGSILFE
ncbi:MAG: YggS family pyridoxal phosphate-dependent enzyme [Ruminococcaceae bacterium]|nr:YggS family pyridoxal phosphate-dependent enzyme [Oscillospiraceae bacterium]